MLPVTFVGGLYKTHAVLCSKIADVHGIEVHNVRTWKCVYFPKIFRFLSHITLVYSKCRNLFTKLPANQWQSINHKLFKTTCYWLSKPFDRTK